MKLKAYRKAVVATAGAVVAILATQGIDVDPTISVAIISLFTAVLVSRVPNASE